MRLGARQRPTPTDVIVLCYHAVSDDWPASLAVTPSRLESQLRVLVGRGYRGATFSEAVLAPPAPRTVAITFDDAYRSVLDLAFPVLERLELPATVFVPTAFPGKAAPMAWPGIDRWLRGPHEHELMPLSWDELARLADADWEIGSHTHTHPRLTALDRDSLARELTGSREECERQLGLMCRSISYPYGDHDERVVAAAAAAGYATACTLPARLHAPARLRWPRVGVYRVDHVLRFRLKISSNMRRLRASRGWNLLGLLRNRPRPSSV
jgi:peptidoglycan/xylan/chitin deacetylase (PgdA/CDA1 family)